MPWSGQEAYNKAPWVNFTVDGKLAGNFTGTDLLGFLKVGCFFVVGALHLELQTALQCRMLSPFVGV